MTVDVVVAAVWTATFVCLPWLYDRMKTARREPLARNPRRATNKENDT